MQKPLTSRDSIRWSAGERLHHLFEARCDEFESGGDPGHLAVSAAEGTMTFRQLDNRANQLARYLKSRGLAAGDRIGLLFDKSAETYVALLAVMKIHAAFVPLDAGFPEDRIAFILEDAGVKAVVSQSPFRGKLANIELPCLYVDDLTAEVASHDVRRLTPSEIGPGADELCYVIYTSGTTGKPKGVAVEHASICNFVRVAAEEYGFEPHDRVFQGMTIAFDFSVEELWVPLLAGSTLVPARPGATLVGDELATFLIEHHVTAMCCVPTLLATIERDIPALRILLVSGEACPQGLVTRWHAPGRTMLNAYGPTEATVTATLTRLYPEKPVTIGRPLPTYMVVILDEHEPRELPKGGLGEICIAGVGLAAGYLNRPDLTAQKFIPDVLGLPNNPSRRIYRTGDLGRINDDGEIEYLGRIDTQVKIRGYRIELTEIESVLLEQPEIAQAVVHTWESVPGTIELVAYYALAEGAAELDRKKLATLLRSRLPSYMVPAYLEELPIIPMTVNHKADRKQLPPPTGPRLAAGSATIVAPTNATEEIMARELCQTLNLPAVSIDDHFFYDLGGHSLLMARFCSALRQHSGLGNVAIRDIYLNPTIRQLAAHAATSRSPGLTAIPEIERAKPTPPHEASTAAYLGCGALQLAAYAIYGTFLIWLIDATGRWAGAGANTPEIYARSVLALGAEFAVLTLIPVAVKWTIIGRFRETVFPVWSFAYFRFWLVKLLTQTAPAAFFPGTELYAAYLRLLGARIGKGTVIMTRAIPVCTDLIEIGSNCILRSEALLLGYKAEAGRIHTGAVYLGDDVVVGEGSVLDIGTRMESGAQLGHASALHEGCRVPAGARYHGSPAVPCAVDYCAVTPHAISSAKRWAFSLGFLAFAIALAALPFALVAVYIGRATSETAAVPSAFDWSLDVETIALASSLIVLAPIIISALWIGLTRLTLRNALEPGRSYPLFGWHYLIHQLIQLATNSPLLNHLFGDTSYVVGFLQFVGYDLGKVVQTGSNFGCDQRHSVPYLCKIGGGTMVSDGLVMMNSTLSASSFRIDEVKVGEANYFGNFVRYPSGGRTGDNCLFATKVMIPLDGPIRENVGLLGSPPFEIPRVTARDAEASAAIPAEERAASISAKNKHNIASVAIYLVSLWLLTFVSLAFFDIAYGNHALSGFAGVAIAAAASALYMILHFALFERAVLGFRRLDPIVAPMLSPPFWRHERYWKMLLNPLIHLAVGTPMRSLLLRLIGVEVGRKVFDDGGTFVERTLVEIGDYATINSFSALHGHSLEEGVFKRDRIKIETGATVGVGAVVHYDTVVGARSIIEADSFVMKGVTTEPGTIWRGNPAQELSH